MSQAISVTPSELRAYASKLKQWAGELRSIKQNIISKTRQLENHWQDSQFRLYLSIATEHAETLAKSIESFEENAKVLEKQAQRLQEEIDRRRRELETLRRSR